MWQRLNSILYYAIIRKVKKQTFYMTVKTKSNIFIFLKLLFAVHIFNYLCGLGCFGGSSAVWACWLHPFSYTHDTGTTRACWFHPFSYNHDTGTTRTCWFVMSVRKGVKLACSGSTPFFTLMIMTKVQPEHAGSTPFLTLMTQVHHVLPLDLINKTLFKGKYLFKHLIYKLKIQQAINWERKEFIYFLSATRATIITTN